MVEVKAPKGRPRRYARFEEFEANLPRDMKKRPAYCDGIGIFNGANNSSAWVKVRMPRGGAYKGRAIPINGAVEIKIGSRASWDWPEWLAERDRLQGLADRGEPLEEEIAPTFATYADQWLQRKKPTMKGFGIANGHVKSALNPTFGKRALDAISSADVNGWIAKQSTKVAPSTVQRQLATFNAIMNDAVRAGILERNPSSRADKVKGAVARQRFVTDAEYQAILATVDRIEAEQEADKVNMPQQIRGWLRHFVVWAINSGMRRGEILALRFHHIRTIGEGHVVVEVITSKTDKPRTITCTKEMIEIIAALAALERRQGDDRLFPLSMATLKRSLTKLWKECGLEDIRLHDLRRTHATKLIQANVDPRTVAGRLGHSGTAMLSKHYAVDQGDMEAVRRFEEMLALTKPDPSP